MSMMKYQVTMKNGLYYEFNSKEEDFNNQLDNVDLGYKSLMVFNPTKINAVEILINPHEIASVEKHMLDEVAES